MKYCGKYILSDLMCSIPVRLHVDAPAHFIDGGKSVQEIPLEKTVGPETAPKEVHLILLKSEAVLLEGVRLAHGFCGVRF